MGERGFDGEGLRLNQLNRDMVCFLAEAPVNIRIEFTRRAHASTSQ